MTDLTKAGATRTLAEIEALVPGFTAAQSRIESAEAAALAPDEALPSFLEWFEGERRWANVVTYPNGNASITVYEETGQYCDEWRHIAGRGWVHAETGSFLDSNTDTVRDATGPELDGL